MVDYFVIEQARSVCANIFSPGILLLGIGGYLACKVFPIINYSIQL
jgi:hypothetical protein